jgi:hypothetical protein
MAPRISTARIRPFRIPLAIDPQRKAVLHEHDQQHDDRLQRHRTSASISVAICPTPEKSALDRPGRDHR